MSGLKQGFDVWMELADRLPELQDLDVSEMTDFRGEFLANKILGNSDIEADYSALTLYRCMLLSPIKNALEIGTFNFAHTGRILSNVKVDLSLSSVHIQGQSLELHGAKLRNVRVTSSLIENYTFKECSFRKCDFSGTRFVDVKFLGTKFYASNFEECTFKNCTFDCADDDGGDWLENTEVDDRSSFKNTRFEDCTFFWFIYDSTFEYSELFIRMFEGSNIESSDLPDIQF
jgi:uncharacterized protein YjbI with pentapeptide repeats